MGVAAADASEVNTADADDVAAAALLMAVEAVDAAASPAVPGGNVSRTPAVDDPGITSTATAAPGYCASIAD